MNSTESLTRTLPAVPTRFLTTNAVEMPFRAFANSYTKNSSRKASG